MGASKLKRLWTKVSQKKTTSWSLTWSCVKFEWSNFKNSLNFLKRRKHKPHSKKVVRKLRIYLFRTLIPFSKIKSALLIHRTIKTCRVRQDSRISIKRYKSSSSKALTLKRRLITKKQQQDKLQNSRKIQNSCKLRQTQKYLNFKTHNNHS